MSKTLEQEEIEILRTAFETTRDDRDIWKRRCQALGDDMAFLFEQFAKEVGVLAPLPAPPAAPVGRIQTPQGKDNPDHAYAHRIPDVVAPNVFCVGAMKSGTSYLYSVLREHPKIRVYAKDSGKLRYVYRERRSDLFREFLPWTNADYAAEPLLGQFEVGFSVLPNGAEVIAEDINPDARIIFCIRNPVDRMQSHYLMRLRQATGSGVTFRETMTLSDALDEAEDAKRRTEKGGILYLNNWGYVEHSQYYERIKSYRDVFGHDNVLVLVFEDDIVRNPHIGFLKTFSFLGLRDEDAVRISRSTHDQFRQASTKPQAIEAFYLLRDGSVVAARDIAEHEIARAGIERIRLTSPDDDTFSLTIDRPVDSAIHTARRVAHLYRSRLTSEERAQLYHRYFAEDVAKLEKLLGRDLSMWLP